MNGHTAVVALLLRLRDDVDVNRALTTKGTTPLSAAEANGHARITALLLARGAIGGLPRTRAMSV